MGPVSSLNRAPKRGSLLLELSKCKVKITIAFNFYNKKLDMELKFIIYQ